MSVKSKLSILFICREYFMSNNIKKIGSISLTFALCVIGSQLFSQRTNAQLSSDPGSYYSLKNNFTGDGKCIDIVNDGANNKLTMANCGNYTGQSWSFSPEKLSSGEIIGQRIRNRFSGEGKCLDIVNDGTNNKLIMADCGNFSGQVWNFRNSRSLINNFTGDKKCLDIVNDGSNNKLNMADCGNYSGQFWSNTTPGPKVVKMEYLNTEQRENGLQTFIYENVTEPVTQSAIEGQIPQMFLNISANVGVYKNQRYINFNTAGSRVAASTSGKLVKNQQDLRGWYLEYVDVSIESLNPNFTLASYGPSTSQQEGSVTSSSGIDFASGAAISKDGPSASLSFGLNFGMSYSSNLASFRVLDNSTGNKVVTKTKLTSTNASETWSNPKGGNAPYENSNDLIRIDAAGQFSGTPLNYLPDLAISNLSLSSMGTFKATNDFKGTALFKVRVKMHLLKVEKTNKVFSVSRNTQVKDLSVERTYAIDMNR